MTEEEQYAQLTHEIAKVITGKDTSAAISALCTVLGGTIGAHGNGKEGVENCLLLCAHKVAIAAAIGFTSHNKAVTKPM